MATADEAIPVHEGMRVLGPHGEHLGYVSAVGPTHFEVSQLTHPGRVWDVPLAALEAVRAGDVLLQHGWEDLHPILDDDGGALPPRQGDLEGEPSNL
jgi:hypothetical protein